MPNPVRLVGCAMLLALGAAACAPVNSHQGYVIDKELADAIQPGIDNRDSVLGTLGRPTLTSQFSGGDWYYVSRNSSNLAFQGPRTKVQRTLRIRFDPAGNVASVNWTDENLIASIDPYGKKTPTLGRKTGFFQDLFGNIGTVGAPGMGAPPQGQ